MRYDRLEHGIGDLIRVCAETEALRMAWVRLAFGLEALDEDDAFEAFLKVMADTPFSED